MAIRTGLDRSDLLQLARSLTPLQRQIVLALRDRGPGLLLEVAVRVLKFPEEISQPVANLREKQVVEFTKVSGGAIGGDMISLSPVGERLASQLRDEAFLQQLETPAPGRVWDPQAEEVAILQRLGDLAAQQGDVAAASYHYRQALIAIRRLPTIQSYRPLREVMLHARS